MLTKQEREAIAERANKATYRSDSIYEVLLGHISPDYVPLNAKRYCTSPTSLKV